MAQYPQGIFQSLQYLLKKVKILALDKQPVYKVTAIGTNAIYTIRGRGFYNIIDNTSVNASIQFPDPALMQGQTIILYAYLIYPIISTYAPLIAGVVLTDTALQSTYTFVSNGTNWMGTSLT